MAKKNPFAGRDPFKKIVLNVSLTVEQNETVEALMAFRGAKTRSALVKDLLREATDKMNEEQKQ